MADRIIPLDDSFMKDKKTNEKVWSYLQIKSYKTNDDKRFVYNTDEVTPQAIHKAISRVYIDEKKKKVVSDISLNTVRNTLKLYYKLGFIYKETIKDIYNKDREVIVLSQKFNYYSLIPLETLRFLVDTANANVIKIYAFLINKYSWKQKEGQKYNFNLKGLCAEIGYSAKAENSLMMRNIIKSLSNNGLIEYKETYFISKDNKPIPTFVLLNASYYPRQALSVGLYDYYV